MIFWSTYSLFSICSTHSFSNILHYKLQAWSQVIHSWYILLEDFTIFVLDHTLYGFFEWNFYSNNIPHIQKEEIQWTLRGIIPRRVSGMLQLFYLEGIMLEKTYVLAIKLNSCDPFLRTISYRWKYLWYLQTDWINL